MLGADKESDCQFMVEDKAAQNDLIKALKVCLGNSICRLDVLDDFN